MSGSEKLIESQRSKAAFRDSEEHYRAVAEAATDAIITIDSDSTILIVNPATEKIFGYSTEEMIGQPLTMLMPEYLRHLHKAGITRYMETGRKHIGWSAAQLPGLHKTGNEVPLEISFAEFTRDGRRFFTGIDPPNLVKARDSAELIIRDGDRASHVIARIRALLKKSPPSKTLLDANEFVNEVVGLIQNEMARNSVRLRLELADDLPRVPGDRIQLQVLLNLIFNAVEAMLTVEDRQRALLIATDIFANTRVRVAVSDNGQGIDPQTADHLFDAFSTTKPDGMGMGLAISRSIIEETEVALCTAGIALDYGGPQYDQIPPDEMNSILTEFPRLDMKRCFTESVCGIIRAKPETTYDNFARDFGERFVPGYKPQSSVDFLMNAPFQE